jgi:hypothetical protein
VEVLVVVHTTRRNGKENRMSNCKMDGSSGKVRCSLPPLATDFPNNHDALHSGGDEFNHGRFWFI